MCVKKVILPGLAAGVAMLVIGMGLNQALMFAFPSLNAEYNNTNIYRPWSDPAMSLYFLYPFVLGIVLALAWDKVKVVFKDFKEGDCIRRGASFGFGIWAISSIPGMLVTYSSFQVSALVTATWTLSGLVNGVVAGIIFAKLNK